MTHGRLPSRPREHAPRGPGGRGQERVRLQRLDAANVERLQRAAGNASVRQLLAPRVSVQRYEAGEHAQFGGDFLVAFKAKQRKHGASMPEITEGDVIALGDLYETPRSSSPPQSRSWRPSSG